MGEIDWFSGFEVMGNAFEPFAHPALLLQGWATLLIFGWILGYAVIKTRSLYLAIALHAGFVFALRSFELTSRRLTEPTAWLGPRLTVGLIPVLMLLVTGLCLWYLLRRKSPKRESDLGQVP